MRLTKGRINWNSKTHVKEGKRKEKKQRVKEQRKGQRKTKEEWGSKVRENKEKLRRKNRSGEESVIPNEKEQEKGKKWRKKRKG